MFKNILIIAPAFVLIVFIANAFFTPSTKFLGLNYNASKDYSCCKQGKLIMHHYYTFYFFGIKMAEGYTDEKINLKNVNDCKIVCID